MANASIPIMRGDAIGAEVDYRDALPINYTVVSREILGAKGYLVSHPGLVQVAEGVGPDRGGNWNERLEEHYRVSGQRFIRVDEDGTVTELGDVPGADRATMTAYSFNTQAIVAGGKYYLYDGTTFEEVVDPDVGTPIDVCWIDFYYFFTDGERLYHTRLIQDPEDPNNSIPVESAIDENTFATAEFSPDPSLGVAKTSDNRVAVFNRYTTEWFVNRASENFAFRRLDQRAVKCGIVGTHCKVEMEGRFYVMGSGKDEAVSVHFLQPGSYKSIASREVDRVISEYNEAELRTAWLETRIENRDKFIIVQLPRDTLVYNETIAKIYGAESAWTILKSDEASGATCWRGVNGIFDPHKAQWVYGDKLDGRIGALADETAALYGEAVESLFTSPMIKLETQSINALELETIPGIQREQAEVRTFISLSYDGRRYEQEYPLTYGKQYDSSSRFIYRRMGNVRDYASLRFRTISTERLNFAGLKIDYG